MNRAISHNIRDAAGIIIKAPYLFVQIDFIRAIKVYVNTLHMLCAKEAEEMSSLTWNFQRCLYLQFLVFQTPRHLAPEASECARHQMEVKRSFVVVSPSPDLTGCQTWCRFSGLSVLSPS